MARLAGLLASKPWPWVKEGPEPVMLGVGTVVRSGLGCAPGERDRTRGLRQPRYIKNSYKAAMLRAWAAKTLFVVGIVELVVLPLRSGRPSTGWPPGP